VNGLFAKLSDSDFVEYVTSFDVCVLSETFTLPSFDFSIYFNDFIILHSPAVKLSRMGRNSGGLVILIRKRLSEFVKSIDTKHENILCSRLSKQLFGCEKDVLFVGLYNHPVGSAFYENKEYSCSLDLLEQFLLSQMESGEDPYFLIGGDFNSRIGDWSFDVLDDVDDDDDDYVYTFERRSQDTVINNFGKNLIQLCYMFDLVPLNGLVCKEFDERFTFYSERGNSTIDYFVSSVDFVTYVCSLSVAQRVESQHMPVLLGAHAIPSHDNQSDSTTHSSDKMKWDSSKAQLYLDYLLSENSRRRIDEATNEINGNIDNALGKFISILLDAGQCMRRVVHFGRRSRCSNQWFDHECRQLKREASRALNRYLRTLRDCDRVVYIQKRSLYQSALKEKKKAHKEQVRNSLLESRNDTNKFWSVIRRVRSRVYNRVAITINAWREHFTGVLGRHVSENVEVNLSRERELIETEIENENIYTFGLDRKISEFEVREAIRKMKSGKAPGLDEISAEFLKSAETIVTPFLTKLFNKLFETGYFPEEWSRSVIVPLFKKGDKNNPANYRGISLLSTVSKIFTSILNKRLYSWAEYENKICEEQAGFRKQYATTDHIFTLVSMIRKCLYGRRKSKLYVVFIDYLVAFDSVDRDSLWLVLQKIKTSTKMLNMLQGMYKSVQSCVRWGHEMSDFFDCPFGVKQGCLLSPLIFSLLITDVADKVTKNGKHGFQFLPGLQEIFLLLFADDICLISTTPAGLQNQINNLEKASDALGLVVNLSKTKVMVFRKGGHLAKSEKWFYKGQALEIVNSYKYLGFMLTTKLSFELALEEYTGRAKRKVVEIMKTMWKLETLDFDIFFKLFDAQVKPMLLYAAEIWGLTRFQVIESVHLFACKRFLKVAPQTPNTLIYGELGRFPLYIDSALSSIRYWFKLQKLLLVRLPKQAYVMDKNNNVGNLTVAHTHSWSVSVKRCFDLFGFSNVWLNGGVGNEKAFLKLLKQRMIDCYRQDWSNKLNDSDRFCTYRSFKCLFEPERYLTDITIVKFRNVLVRFRMGVNELNVNNRYTNKSHLCPFCEAIENEMHFLFHCSKYKEIREKYIMKYIKNAYDASLVFLLQNENVFVTRSVAMYLFYALKLRENLLKEYICPT